MLLIFFGLPAAMVWIAALLGLVRHARQRIREGNRPRLASPKPLMLVFAVSLSAVFLVYSYATGVYSPGLFPDKTCYFRMGARTFPESFSEFPISTICSGVEIVPSWVNPTLFALIAVSAATLGATPFAYLVRRFPATLRRTRGGSAS
ncbi:hypothetical protein ACFY12_04335 [Streptomyces sp. NPDC001339]|uniref:hypothetical protein n=1 Tax=Streptomyces sp. NPDC001339 TaxID=3364563 RepID=UPI0036BEEA92